MKNIIAILFSLLALVYCFKISFFYLLIYWPCALHINRNNLICVKIRSNLIKCPKIYFKTYQAENHGIMKKDPY